jgi:hypothetical protein
VPSTGYARLVLGRRLVILVVVLMGLTALAASVAPPPENPRRGARETPTPSPAPATTMAADPDTISLSLEAGQDPQQLRATVGEDVALEVSADVVDTVVIEGLDAVEAVAPDSAAHFDLFADRAGTYPIRLLDADRQIGELVISSMR